jgi:hypothetical protein
MRERLPWLLIAALTSALALAAVEEKTNVRGIGTERIGLMKSDPTDAGTFDGTWMYVNRDSRFALWVRTKDGRRQVKVQYQSLAGPEAFETDWDGKADYFMAGNPVSFELRLADGDASKLKGAWSWDLKIGNSARVEKSEIVLYRTGYGRTMQMDFVNFERTLRRNGVDQTARIPTSWSWTKVSKRELLWAELPF